ncbi:hypothetical protein [Aeromicrobium sp. P5_D10]
MGLGAVEVGIILVPLVVLVLVLVPRGWSYDVADEAIVHGVSFETADQVLFRELSDVRGLPLLEAHAGSYTLTRNSRAGWTILAAVLLFPFGLVFLLFTREDRLQVSLSEHSSGCRLRVVGTARRRDIDNVAASIRRVLPVPDSITR